MSSRTRSREQTVSLNRMVSYHETWTYPTNPPAPGNWSWVTLMGPASYVTNTESIVDDDSPLPRRGRGRRSATLALLDNGNGKVPYKPVKDVDHERTITSYTPNLTLEYTRNLGWVYKYHSYTAASAKTLLSTLPGGDNLSSPLWGTANLSVKTDWFALRDSFREACEQFLQNELILGETLYESGIFLDAFKFLTNPVGSTIRHLGRLIGSSDRKLSLGALQKKFHRASDAFERTHLRGGIRRGKHIASSTASDYLMYHFAVKPAIQDAISILSAHSRVQARLNYLRSRAGKYVRVRVAQELPVSMPPKAHPNNFAQATYSLITEASNVARIGGWGLVRTDFSHADTWQAYTQYFGLNKIAGTLWELIPFSFLLDWVTSAQEYVNSYTRQNTSGPFLSITATSASETIKQTTTGYIAGEWNGSVGMYPIDRGPIVFGTREYTRYRRYAKIPDGSGVFDTSHLDFFKGSLAGALLLQLGKRR